MPNKIYLCFSLLFFLLVTISSVAEAQIFMKRPYQFLPDTGSFHFTHQFPLFTPEEAIFKPIIDTIDGLVNLELAAVNGDIRINYELEEEEYSYLQLLALKNHQLNLIPLLRRERIDSTTGKDQVLISNDGNNSNLRHFTDNLSFDFHLVRYKFYKGNGKEVKDYYLRPYKNGWNDLTNGNGICKAGLVVGLGVLTWGVVDYQYFASEKNRDLIEEEEKLYRDQLSFGEAEPFYESATNEVIDLNKRGRQGRQLIVAGSIITATTIGAWWWRYRERKRFRDYRNSRDVKRKPFIAIQESKYGTGLSAVITF